MPSSWAQRSPVSWNSTVCGYFGLSASSTTNSRLVNRSDTCLVSKIVWSFPEVSMPMPRTIRGGSDIEAFTWHPRGVRLLALLLIGCSQPAAGPPVGNTTPPAPEPLPGDLQRITLDD